MRELTKTGFAHRLVTGLLRLGNRQMVVVFVALAMLVSMAIVLVIDLLWDGRLSPELQVAGVITPAIDGILVFGLFVSVLTELRAEAARRKSAEQVLNEAQRLAHIGNWSLDLRTERLQWSDEIFHIFEIDPSQFAASYEGFLERVHPDDRAMVDEAFRTSVASHRPYDVTHRLLLPDGRVKHVAERGASFYDDDGRPLRTIGTVQDVTDRVVLEQELRRLATTDALTGIANRHYFDHLLHQEVERSRRYNAPLSLVMFDIDHFKRFNDSYGHEMGDKVLVHLAQVVQSMLRSSDVLARWGGEEFLILAPHTGIAEALQLAERLRAAVEQTPLDHVPVTISLGVATRTGDMSTDALLRGADEALYGAKAAGRNRAVAHSCADAPKRREKL